MNIYINIIILINKKITHDIFKKIGYFFWFYNTLNSKVLEVISHMWKLLIFELMTCPFGTYRIETKIFNTHVPHVACKYT